MQQSTGQDPLLAQAQLLVFTSGMGVFTSTSVPVRTRNYIGNESAGILGPSFFLGLSEHPYLLCSGRNCLHWIFVLKQRWNCSRSSVAGNGQQQMGIWACESAHHPGVLVGCTRLSQQSSNCRKNWRKTLQRITSRWGMRGDCKEIVLRYDWKVNRKWNTQLLITQQGTLPRLLLRGDQNM